jgi:hypothetical protein
MPQVLRRQEDREITPLGTSCLPPNVPTLRRAKRSDDLRVMDGHKFESLELIVDNEQGLIVERTIALRPYPALKLFRDAMYAALKDKLPPDVWDYPTP